MATDVAHGSLALESDGSFVYTPHADFFGMDSFSYRAGGGENHFEPVAVMFTGGIWDAAPTTLGGGPIPGLEQFVQANVQFSEAGITTAAEGRLVRLMVDTTGFSEGTFDLLLKDTEIPADTDFVGTPAHIVNGTTDLLAQLMVADVRKAEDALTN